ncbi:hypothetical protein [Pseudomonas faucium]|uniref:hypothetical protein n=1 Tax=Pseudomonas faucium TaxID=2740518 RepID=UPI0039C13288
MINLDAWPMVIKLPFLIVPVVIALSGAVMNACITLSRDYNVVCSSVTTNPYIESLKNTWGGSSFKWRYFLVGAIGGLVTFPQFVLRRGQLDANELGAFPPNLKRKLAISSWLIIIGFGWMVVAALLLKISE